MKCDVFIEKERAGVTEKARRWFSEYLRKNAGGVSSDQDVRVQKRIVRVSCDVLCERMRSDESFYESVRFFCSKRRTAAEKEAFFSSALHYVRDQIRDEYIQKYSPKAG